MDLKAFEFTTQSRRPVVIVLRRDDYEQLKAALPADPGDGDREKMQYRGSPIVLSEFFHSYIVEDTPDGPLIHFVP